MRTRAQFFVGLAIAASFAISLPTRGQAVALVSSTKLVESGEVSGVVLDEDEGLVVYRGIPFAAPPVGELRWRPPRKVDSWEGVRACHEFGPGCIQRRRWFAPQKQSEDCLYLNIWTTAENRAAKRPVMVWIHGGGLSSGSGHQANYNGSEFAKRGVVLVTINYRLGPLGFLAHPALSEESNHKVSGNYGFLDQIAALNWIQRNISVFGGDPNNVTIFGESAGGTSVSVLCSSPLSKGLFHRAILQSPWMFGYISNMAEPVFVDLKEPTANAPSSEQLGSNWAANHVDATGQTAIAELRKLDAKSLVENQGYYKTRATIDGHVLPDRPQKIFSQGLQADVPTMIGTTDEEGNYFRTWLKFESREGFESRIRRFYGEQTELVSSLYPQEVGRAASRYVTDGWFLQPARRMLRGMGKVSSQAYQYEFTKPNKQHPELGAMHAGEIRYVFNTLKPNQREDDSQRLAETMINYWVQFASTGNPNRAGLPPWPEYQAHEAKYLELGDEIKSRRNLRDEICDQLDQANDTVY